MAYCPLCLSFLLIFACRVAAVQEVNQVFEDHMVLKENQDPQASWVQLETKVFKDLRDLLD